MGQIPVVLDASEGGSPVSPVIVGTLLSNHPIDLAIGAGRAMNGVAMSTVTIDTIINVTAFTSLEPAQAAKIHTLRLVRSTRNSSSTADFPNIRHR
jgi:hypothetical protein